MSCSSPGVSHSFIHCTLQEQQLYPYNIQCVQELEPHDKPARSAVYQWILQQLTEDPTFTAKFLFMDEQCLTMSWITNIHNKCVVRRQSSCNLTVVDTVMC
jgi:hypothetical protein